MPSNEEEVTLYDSEDNVVGKVKLPKRRDDQEPRGLIYKGKAYIEGGRPQQYYGIGEFVEVPIE